MDASHKIFLLKIYTGFKIDPIKLSYSIVEKPRW